MARYLYRCKACQRSFEVEKPMAISARTEACPDCRTEGERMFTPAATVVKGAKVSFADSAEGSADCANCEQGGCSDRE